MASFLAGISAGVPLKPQTIRVRDRSNKIFLETINRSTGEIQSNFLEVDTSKNLDGLKDNTKRELHPRRFDTDKGVWTLGSDSELQTQISSFTCVSYNVWFSHLNWQARARALFELVHNLMPTVICFQEVTPHFLKFLLQQVWVREHYFIADSSQSIVMPYGIFMLSLLPFRSCALYALPTSMGRRLLVSEFSIDKDSSVVVGTVHLESLDNISLRCTQLDVIHEIVAKFEHKPFILTGDFNFNCLSTENDYLKTKFRISALGPPLSNDGGLFSDGHLQTETEKYDCVDCWQYCIGYTDLEPCRTRRGLLIDRCLLHQSVNSVLTGDVATTLEPSSIIRIGSEPFCAIELVAPSDTENDRAVEDESQQQKKINACYPSDHDGLFISFELRRDQDTEQNISK